MAMLTLLPLSLGPGMLLPWTMLLLMPLMITRPPLPPSPPRLLLMLPETPPRTLLLSLTLPSWGSGPQPWEPCLLPAARPDRP